MSWFGFDVRKSSKNIFCMIMVLILISGIKTQTDHAIPEDDYLDTFCANTSMNFMMMWTTDAESWRPRFQRTMESALYHHPNACIRFFSDSITSNHSTIHALRLAGYRVTAIPLVDNLQSLFSGTPVIDWWERRTEWEEGKFYYSHLTDAIRFNLLWRYGGAYIDGDVIVLKSMQQIRNVVGVQMSQLEDQVRDEGPRWQDMLNGAIMVFNKGHPALWEMMLEFNRTYNMHKWAHNDARLITRVVHRLNTEGTIEQRVTILPRTAFYPLVWTGDHKEGARNWFNEGAHPLEEHLDRWRLMKSQGYAVHWHNHNTYNQEAVKGSLMWLAFNEFCILCREPAS